MFLLLARLPISEYTAPVPKMGTRNVYGPCPQDGYEECIRPLSLKWVRGMYTAPLPKMGTRKVQTAMSPRWCDRNMKTVKYDFSQRAYSPYTHNYHMSLVYKEISHEIAKIAIIS